MKIKELKCYTSLLRLLGAVSSNDKFSYKVNENGEYIASGSIEYGDLKKYKVVELKFNDVTQIYIVSKYIHGEYAIHTIEYTNIYTGEIIYKSRKTTSSIELIEETDLNDYLIFYDEVKAEYNIEDIDRIYAKIQQDYEVKKEREKTISKGTK